ncbi:MAG: hypothetical protein AAFN94_01615 [Pseudomonadota bacterium]
MIEFPVPGPAFAFHLDASQNGTLFVDAAGPGISLIEANAPPNPVDPDAITPDPVEFLSSCVAEGLFARWDMNGPEAQFEIQDTDVAGSRQTWRVTYQNLDPGVLRILANMLVARGLETLSITGDQPPQASFAPGDIPLPTHRPPDRFEIDYKMPAVSNRERSVLMTFHTEPSDAEHAQVIAFLDMWNTLVLLGAYPMDDQSPRDSGFIPEMATLAGAHAIVQDIDIAFACSEAAFVPIPSYFTHGNGKPIPLQKLTLR